MRDRDLDKVVSVFVCVKGVTVEREREMEKEKERHSLNKIAGKIKRQTKPRTKARLSFLCVFC